MIPALKSLDHEECWALFLNRANLLLGREMICSGSMESTLVDTGKILRRAIEKQSSYVILVHNHPSGSPLPGPADIHQTEMVRKALSAVEISLMDHVVIADGSFFSFSEERVGQL
jgi:DNA repair protein RadC